MAPLVRHRRMSRSGREMQQKLGTRPVHIHESLGPSASASGSSVPPSGSSFRPRGSSASLREKDDIGSRFGVRRHRKETMDGTRESPIVPRVLSDAVLGCLDRTAGALIALGVSANAVTVVALQMAAVAGILLAFGHFGLA